LERKLCRLEGGSLLDRYVAKHSRLLIALLQASYQGLFHDLSRAEREPVLRILAYVRKEEDAVPDYRRDGFRDDAQEIRALEAKSAPLLQRFKHWRLRHQVPAIWLNPPSGPVTRLFPSDASHETPSAGPGFD
jgi:hypothetical protein